MRVIRDSRASPARAGKLTRGFQIHGFRALLCLILALSGFQPTFANRVHLTIYPDGELKTVTDEIGRQTTFGIDANGRVISASVAGTPATTKSYDADGRVTAVTDPLHRTTSYGYDGLGRMNALVLPDGTKYKMTRDLAGRLTDVDKTQAGESGTPRRWHFDYDAVNRLTKRTDPLGNYTSLEYDAVGNVTKVDEPGENGARLVTTYPDYDPLNRPKKIVRPDETVDIVYNDQRDGAGLHGVTITLTRPGRPTTTVVRRLDALERLVDEQVGDNTTSYAYDANSNVTDVFLSTAAMSRTKVLHYELDARNRVTSIQDVRANRTVTLTWDAASQLTRVTYPSGITKDITPGLRGETTDIVYKTSAGSVIRALHYAYDDALQLKRRDDTVGLNPVQSTSFDYNLRGELTIVNYPDGTGERFSYDGSGNIVEYDKVNGAQILSELRFHDAADQLYNISGARQVSLTHDPRGNVTSVTEGALTRTFTWDAAGRLLGVGGSAALTADYADDYRLTLIQDGAQPAIKPVWGLDNMLAEIAADGSETFTLHLPELDSPIERGPPAGNSRETLLTDTLMGAIGALDDTGTIVRTTEYNAYGTVRAGADPGLIGFHGARKLGSTGLYALRNRMYSPELGRFLSRDPIGFSGGWNQYGYAGGNPVGGRDPSGLAGISYWPDGSTGQVRGIGRRMALGTSRAQHYGTDAGLLVVDPPVGVPAVIADGLELSGNQQSADQFRSVALALSLRGVVPAVAEAGGVVLGSLSSRFRAALAAARARLTPCPPAFPGAMGIAPEAFQNRLPERLAHELATAERLGVSPVSPGTPEFAELVTAGPIKFVVTLEGELLAVPFTHKTEEIAHAVASGGRPVLTAGVADIAHAEGMYFGTALTEQSGHYYPTMESVQTIARPAFARHGILFPLE